MNAAHGPGAGPGSGPGTGGDKGASAASSGKGMSSDLLRGHTDTIVLGILRRGDNYGFAIYKEILDATGGEYELKEATLYASFRRLVADGAIEAYWGDESQGGRRKYYRITDAGIAQYRRNKADWDIAQRIINRLLTDKD